MFPRSIHQSLRLFFSASLVVVLAISLAPVQTAQADVFTADLAIELVSAPRHARACQVFEAKFRITNLGPDATGSFFVSVASPDTLGYLDLQDVPETLAAGESAVVTVVYKVVAFTPGSSRNAWIGAGISADPYPDTSVDLDPSNNEAERPLKLVGRPSAGPCP